MPNRRIIFISVVLISLAVFAVQTQSQTDNPNQPAKPYAEDSQFGSKVADSLNVRWRSIEYRKTLYNPALTMYNPAQGQPKADRLSVSCEVDMPKPELVLGTCNDCVIEQITDSQGRDIEIGNVPSRSMFIYRDRPRFRVSRGYVGLDGGPEPTRLRLELDGGLCKRVSGKIGLKGHFYALLAESLEYVDLSFKPNYNWVSITADVQIRVLEAQNDKSSYRFEIEQRPENVRPVFGMRVGDYLPSRLVVGRQILRRRSTMGAGGAGSTGHIGGTGSGSGRAEKIRFTIAVNPTHQTIPFELERIPLATFSVQAPSSAVDSNQTAPAPVKQNLQNIMWRDMRNKARGMGEWTEPQFDKKIAKLFRTRWNSITYIKTLRNPEGSAKDRDQSVSESLSVYCNSEILDPKLIIGTCNRPVIEQVTDGRSRDTSISMSQPRSNSMLYRTLRYGMKFMQPSLLARMEGKVRSVLRLPLRARHRPVRMNELQPVGIGIQLDPGLLGREEIGCIKGYFHVLAADSIRHVKLPFKPDEKWVRLTDDVEIQVSEASQNGSSARFEIKQRGSEDDRGHHLLVGDILPEELVVSREFTSADSRSPNFGSRGSRPLHGMIGGSGGIGGYLVDKIDFKIAVGPKHYKIPFEIEHIPLPEP